MLCPSTPAAPLFFLTRSQASHNPSLRYILSYNAPNFLSSDCFAARERVSCNSLTLFRLFLASRHSRCPRDHSHVVEVGPHARTELWCLIRHHFRATPTPRPPMTASCRSPPACRRLDRRRSVIPRVPCASVSPAVAGTHHHRRPGQMRVPALPSCFPGYVDEERPCENAGGSGATFMSPSPHAIGFTPGSRQGTFPLLPCWHRPSPKA